MVAEIGVMWGCEQDGGQPLDAEKGKKRIFFLN